MAYFCPVNDAIVQKKQIMEKLMFKTIISQNICQSENGQGENDFAAGIATKTHQKTKRPALYRVVLLNDDYTPMEFVVLILQELFHKTQPEAMAIMLTVHNQGVGECGVFPYEVAETKVTQVMDMAQKDQYPLRCVMEKQ